MTGLRPPQLGALFAVGSHWSVSTQPATVIMPTGTGKTETMLAVLAAHKINRLLVAVPSKALRDQTAEKFKHFGLLKALKVLKDEAQFPVVGIATSRPKSADDLQFFRDCNVVIGTVPSLADGTAKAYLPQVVDCFDALLVDEAHHVGAKTWHGLKEAFKTKRVLQFTATPFRGDGNLVEGSVIYSYPLGAAQKDGYFKPIEFLPIQELDDERADATIADTAISRLREDMLAGYDHILMARCRTKERAERVHKIYEQLAPDLKPLLIHSDIKAADERIEKLRSREGRIVVCVNMLGEGIDIPQLKIAAVHDKHQSLAVLLQFIGRFTRTSGQNLGDATVVANIADPQISEALEQLYGEDSDWNNLLSEMSSHAAKDHAELVQFLDNSTALDTDDADMPEISLHSLRPTLSSLFFEAEEFHPKRFFKDLPNKNQFVHGWINEGSNTLFFVTRSTERVKWARAKTVQNTEWDLFILHHDTDHNLLCLASTDKSSNFQDMAKAVGAKDQVSGEQMFKSLGNIGRLVFNNIGVSKHGRKNLSYAMYTGANVKQALSETEKSGSRKSNLSGHGWEHGAQITIGCSYRGRVWSKATGTIPQFVRWAEGVAAKLVDPAIDTKSVLENVLIPAYADNFPAYDVLSFEWPYELISLLEDRVVISDISKSYPLHQTDIRLVDLDRSNSSVRFSIVADDEQALGTFSMKIEGEAGFKVERVDRAVLKLKIGGSIDKPLSDFFNDYPPLIRFMDLSELDGNVILRAENPTKLTFSPDLLEPWDWSKTDITKESIWKGDVERQNSIQWLTAQHYIQRDFDVVFDDDGAGEAADLVCIKLEKDHIRLCLVHCKFSGGDKAGARVKDVVEVASQAVRSARWPGRFSHLLRHLKNRKSRYKQKWTREHFLKGNLSDLAKFQKAEKFMEVRTSIFVVQPGISKANISDSQTTVLASAAAYLKQTLNIDLGVICSD